MFLGTGFTNVIIYRKMKTSCNNTVAPSLPEHSSVDSGNKEAWKSCEVSQFVDYQIGKNLIWFLNPTRNKRITISVHGVRHRPGGVKQNPHPYHTYHE